LGGREHAVFGGRDRIIVGRRPAADGVDRVTTGWTLDLLWPAGMLAGPS
jgi:hypothetical protein